MRNFRQEASGAVTGDCEEFSGGTLPARTLERIIGKPPAAWTSQDLVELFRSKRIRLVSLMHVGGDGWLKTLDFVPRDLQHLQDILEGGERADGSSLFAGKGIREGTSDMLLRPRVESAFLDPFSPSPTLVLMCLHLGQDGGPLRESPDAILRRSYEHLRATTGVDLWALGEVEYFLGKHASESDIYGADERGYHASSPFVFGQTLRRQALVTLAEIGVRVKYGHSEVGYIAATEADDMIWEQHEVELALTPLPQAAESVALTQWVLRNLVHQHGMRCSFDPILRKGHAGSGLHFHLSPMVDGKHAGRSSGAEQLSAPGKWLVAGLVQFGSALMAFGNRSAGSFVRLSQAKEAPTAITWGAYDRHALVRLPLIATTAEGRVVSPPTIEFRLPDGSAHPHLLLAGVAQAMFAGRLTPDLDALLARTSSSSVTPKTGAVTNGDRLPASFPEIADLLAAHRSVLEQGGVFPPSLIDQFLTVLRS
ncbi:MAG: glutamine synthetase beta-grasp domain-containing protein [Acidobacteriia bacterium]|nr:glutamine synthetase beta-grasp domain-containing protein [Terriglobia bacterium]